MHQMKKIGHQRHLARISTQQTARCSTFPTLRIPPASNSRHLPITTAVSAEDSPVELFIYEQLPPNLSPDATGKKSPSDQAMVSERTPRDSPPAAMRILVQFPHRRLDIVIPVQQLGYTQVGIQKLGFCSGLHLFSGHSLCLNILAPWRGEASGPAGNRPAFGQQPVGI